MEESEMILRFQMCTTKRTLSHKETEEKNKDSGHT